MMQKIIAILIGAMTLVAMSANATVIVIGGFSYDSNMNSSASASASVSMNAITEHAAVLYRGGNQIADVNYAQTVMAATAGGTFAGYRIASTLGVQDFHTLASAHAPGSISGTPFAQGPFGNNYRFTISYALYLTPLIGQVELIRTTVGAMDNTPWWTSITTSDKFSAQGPRM